MLSAKGSSLVAGGAAQSDMEKPITVKVERAFMYQGQPVPAGTVIELPATIAWEVIGMGKASRYVAPAAPPATDAPEDPTEDPPARRGRPPKAKEQEP